MLLEVTIGIGIVFVIVSVGLESHVAILYVGKYVPLLVDVVGGFQEYVAVQLVGRRVVVAIVAVGQQRFTQLGMLRIGQVSEVITIVVL